ncbi:MAG: hypothetical protein IPK82_13400 [Polyangiaceae bacterium]|nr:hypothetical protein [Polyangiaceae bacterium]
MNTARRLFVVSTLGSLAVAFFTCTRHADVRDDLGQTTDFDPTPTEDASVPPLDADLGNDAYPSCADRPLGDCFGSDDFPCAFALWAVTVAQDCQVQTGCITNGTVQITMGADGCVSALGMDQPNDAIIECLIEQLSAVNCPCTEEETINHFFGLGNMGTCQ